MTHALAVCVLVSSAILIALTIAGASKHPFTHWLGVTQGFLVLALAGSVVI